MDDISLIACTLITVRFEYSLTQLYGKITLISYQFRETTGRDASSGTTLQVCLRVWRPISFCEEGQRPARGLTV